MSITRAASPDLRLPDLADPRVMMRAAKAAQRLGVDLELLVGLIVTKKVRGGWQPGTTGQPAWFIPYAEVERMERLISTRRTPDA